MSKVLYFHSPSVVELKNVQEKDGEIIIGDKKFSVDQLPEEVKPEEGEAVRLMLKKPFGFEPLYLLKWDCIYPAKIRFDVKDIERKEELENIRNAVEGKQPTKFILASIIFHHDIKNIPESLYKSEKLKILGGMFKVKREIKAVIPLIFGIVVGFAVTILMIYLKLIRV
ncbi:MAG: hypothetical protein ACPLYF_02345 [Fervidobacterium sp.]